MQEIELQQGLFTPRFDARGIERLRFLAMQFEGMGTSKTADANVSPSLRSMRTLGRLIVDISRRAVLPPTRDATRAQMWAKKGPNEGV
jgi:hypothetical protein